MLDVVDRAAGHHADTLALAERAVNHAHEHHHADIVVEPAVDDHRARRAIRVAPWRRHAGDHGLDDVFQPHAGLGAARNGVGGIDADHVLDLRLGVVGVGLRQVHLVQHRDHGDAEVQRGVAVGHRLRFDALRGVDDKQRALAGTERTAHLIRKVDVPRRVNQVELVDLAVARLVLQCGGLRLDGDAAFTLDVHRVKNLRFHFAVAKPATALDDAVGQGALAVIDVGNDGEVADVLHRT